MKVPVVIFLMLIAMGSGQIAAALEEDKEYELIANIVETYVGERFTIELKSNSTTGYGWRLASPLDAEKLALVRSEYVIGNTRLPGAGGKEMWTFRATGPGRVVIAFEYVRSWEKDVPPADKETYGIIIKAKQ